jgi:glycosyltransferase involved in cell wall biosynthesis
VTPILFLASDFTPGCSSRHLARLAASLNPARFQVEIAVLNRSESPAAVPVRSVALRNAFDWTGLRSLKKIANELKPKIIHAWGPTAIRASFSIASSKPDGGHSPRLVVSDASFIPSDTSHWLARRRLRSCDRVVAATWVEAERYRHVGVPADRLTRIAPGIGPFPEFDRAAILKSLDIPPNGRFIVVAGKLDHDSGMKYAVWAFDLVCHEFKDVHLVIIGGGPAREAVEHQALATMSDDYRVRFAGTRVDGDSIIAAADFAWVVNPRGDVRFAVEAMAAGVPVFAWRIPEMAEFLDDGVTGVLIEPGQPAQLATKMYPYLRGLTGSGSLGAAGCSSAEERLPSAKEIEHLESLYGELM